MTVPRAEPRNPQPKPYTNSSSSTRFAAFATARMTSGVRVSERPRRYPLPTSATSTAGTPTALMRR